MIIGQGPSFASFDRIVKLFDLGPITFRPAAFDLSRGGGSPRCADKVSSYFHVHYSIVESVAQGLFLGPLLGQPKRESSVIYFAKRGIKGD